MRQSKRHFSAEFKTKVVLELLKGNKTLNQVASQYEILPRSLASWKKQFLDNASLAFEPAKMVSEYKEQVKGKDAEIEELQKQLGKSVVEVEWLRKELASLDLSERKGFVESGHEEITLTRQCELLSMARSTLYYQPKVLSSQDIAILHRMDEIYTETPFYGHRRIWKQLIWEHFEIGRDRVADYMKILGIRAIYPPIRHNTSKRSQHKVYPYLLGEQEISRPNQVWCGDISYIPLQGGFAYLAVVMDWYSRQVLAWRLDTTMDSYLSTGVLQDALEQYDKPVIFNSDQGSQYTAKEHIEILVNQGIDISMNGKGRSIDNIAVERFFRSLKYENIYLKKYQSVKEAREGIGQYVEFYNHQRIHSSLEYHSPAKIYYQEKLLQAA